MYTNKPQTNVKLKSEIRQVLSEIGPSNIKKLSKMLLKDQNVLE